LRRDTLLPEHRDMNAPLSSRAERLKRRAQIYLAARDFRSAADTYRALLDDAPKDVGSLLALARIELARDAYRDARALALRAAAVRPTPLADLVDLCESLRAFVAEETLIAVCDAAFDKSASLPPGEQRLVAIALTAAGANARAMRWLDRALARAPGDAACLANRAKLHIAAGDFGAARVDLDAALHNREVPFAHWLLAQLERQPDAAAHVERIRAIVDSPYANDDDRAYLGFALHLQLDRLGRHDEAFAALSAGAAAHRRHAPFDEARDIALFEALTQADFGTPGAETNPAADTREPQPIFIVGMFRSGTTLLERLLGAHSDVVDLGESSRFSAALSLAADHHVAGAVDIDIVQRAPTLDYAAAGEAFIAASRARAGAATHFTEKLPSNFLALGFIRRALPRARVVHLVRDPMAVCWSNLRERFLLGAPYSFDQRELGRYFARYHALMAHWHATLPGLILDVRYEDLVTDPAATMHRVLAHCALPWQDACATTARSDSPVNTASAVQVRAPVHRGSVARWRPYATHLAPLAESLAAAGISLDDGPDRSGCTKPR
jgi:tetratricopeptide (TPR) repeat protein